MRGNLYWLDEDESIQQHMNISYLLPHLHLFFLYLTLSGIPIRRIHNHYVRKSLLAEWRWANPITDGDFVFANPYLYLLFLYLTLSRIPIRCWTNFSRFYANPLLTSRERVGFQRERKERKRTLIYRKLIVIQSRLKFGCVCPITVKMGLAQAHKTTGRFFLGPLLGRA